MKSLLYFLIFGFLLIESAYSQPYEDSLYTERSVSSITSSNCNYPTPDNVLVIYKIPSSAQDSIGIISEDVKDYYVDKYNITSYNVLGLTLPDEVTYEGHVVQLFRKAEVIKDTTSAYYDNPDTHAWEYYVDYIETPVRHRLDSVIVGGDSLKYIIRYIVACYGVPYKIQARHDWSGIGGLPRHNISMDGLLTILYYPDVLDLFGTFRYNSEIENPYWQADTDYDFDMRFKSNHFVNAAGTTLNYLVSRLDALDYGTIEGMIDKSTNSNYSGESTWILDGGGPGSSDIANAYYELDNLDFVTEYNYDINTWITTCENSVIGYTSAGTHQGMDSSYIQDTLDFNYSNGSIFNTYESFNANSIRTLTRRAYQALLTEFFLTGGTAGAGHTWEPFVPTVIDDQFWFPAYAMGYTVIDGAYQGMPYLAWQNVVVGDPLSAIAWGKQYLTSDLSWQNTNLVTDTIFIPSNRELSIQSNSTVNLKFNGFITGSGRLTIDSNFTLNITDWSRALLLAVDKEDDHPKLVWGEHPTFSGVIQYNIYRKYDDGQWSYLDNTTNQYFIDEEVILQISDSSEVLFVYYKITAENEREESDYSNTVAGKVKDSKGKLVPDNNKSANKILFAYSLAQNYPNPFNPVTTLTYSIKNDGMVTLKIYDLLGSEIKTLVNENKAAGRYTIKFNASMISSGIYFYKLTSGDYTNIKKMILLK